MATAVITIATMIPVAYEVRSMIEQTVQGKGSQLQGVVELLRSREVSWAQIGAALGISRQSAWERFS